MERTTKYFGLYVGILLVVAAGLIVSAFLLEPNPAPAPTTFPHETIRLVSQNVPVEKAEYIGGGDCSADGASGDLYLNPDTYCQTDSGTPSVMETATAIVKKIRERVTATVTAVFTPTVPTENPTETATATSQPTPSSTPTVNPPPTSTEITPTDVPTKTATPNPTQIVTATLTKIETATPTATSSCTTKNKNDDKKPDENPCDGNAGAGNG